MEEARLAAYRKAQKRVKKIKRFYRHLTVYIVVNILLVYFGLRGVDFIEINSPEVDTKVVFWLFWNVLSVPILWGIGLLIHGLCVFKPKINFIKAWEERQLQKILEEEYRNENSL